MKIHYYGKNITVRESLKAETQKKLSRLDKYFKDDVEAQVTLSTEGAEKRAEITIPIQGTSTILRADQRAEDFLIAVDLCINGLISQVRKHRTKLERRRNSGESIRFAAFDTPAAGSEAPAEEAEEEVVIARKKEVDVSPMTPEEAVDQMEMLGHDFYLFLNTEVDSVCCVYRRKAGNYGLLVVKP